MEFRSIVWLFIKSNILHYFKQLLICAKQRCTFFIQYIYGKSHVFLLPGVAPGTTETCSRLLKDNHQRYHVYFDSKRAFHNHTTHHLLAALGLGASSQTLERIYGQQQKLQQTAHPLHEKKDFDVEKCIGDDNYYPDYLEFFKKELENEKYHGNMEELIEDYLFNKNYLVLALGGVYHSFIHLGYALEFQLKVMAIEGLAMAAIDRVGVKDVLEHLDKDPNHDGDLTALEIIKLVFEDRRFDGQILYNEGRIRMSKFLERGGGPLIAEYAQMWKCDLDDLRRTNVLVNAAVIQPKRALRLDFFLMHGATSSLFLDIFVHALKSKENQLKLLRAKFAVDLLFYVSSGRPKLDLNYLCNEYQPSKEHSFADSQNPWLPLIEKCLTHPEEHVIKTIRALIYAEKFDRTQGKDKLPYLKMAQMVMDALFPVGEKDWVREGLGLEEYWQTVDDQ